MTITITGRQTVDRQTETETVQIDAKIGSYTTIQASLRPPPVSDINPGITNPTIPVVVNLNRTVLTIQHYNTPTSQPTSHPRVPSRPTSVLGINTRDEPVLAGLSAGVVAGVKRAG